ncbi:MAG TPA: patatin-like phospholipase family protein [Xanthomonadaceae bacterium]|nr:patatin-like phospholipase family protein [Xanthomonadaceae bacterium]
MLLIHNARKRTHHHRIGLAVAGGGPIGGMYELGALRALDEAIDGLDPTALDVYVGVSSGAFIAAGLANRLSTEDMCRIFITGDPDEPVFRPEAFVKPAFAEYLKRSASVPRVLIDWLRDLASQPFEHRVSEILGRFGALVPTGIFDNSAIEAYLAQVFARRGRTNDFRALDHLLYIVAVELDTGVIVRFGAEGYDDVPISRAVQASSALPGLYPPVEIKGRHYVDGALRRTLHASVAMDENIDLLLGFNPLVPFDANLARKSHRRTPARLVEGGLPAVLSQTFRTLLQSRMQVGMAKYETSYANVDRIIFEPDADDAEMFFTNVFSYSSRQRMCEHAYQATLSDLRERRPEIEPMLKRHGLELRDDVLNDTGRSLMESLRRRRPRSTETTARLRRALRDLDRKLKAP